MFIFWPWSLLFPVVPQYFPRTAEFHRKHPPSSINEDEPKGAVKSPTKKARKSLSGHGIVANDNY